MRKGVYIVSSEGNTARTCPPIKFNVTNLKLVQQMVPVGGILADDVIRYRVREIPPTCAEAQNGGDMTKTNQ